MNRKTLTPLVWEYPDTQVLGTITYNKDTVLRDPVVIGQELYNYLSNDYKTPIGIEEVNNIVESTDALCNSYKEKWQAHFNYRYSSR